MAVNALFVESVMNEEAAVKALWRSWHPDPS